MSASSPSTDRSRPARIALPDLSRLDTELTANYLLSIVFRGAFPPGTAQHLVTTFVRSIEIALRRYLDARAPFEESVARDSLRAYLRGVSELEVTFIALHRAMRLADAIVRSSETLVPNGHIPTRDERDRLRLMRDAIEHNDEPILTGRAGTEETLMLFVREHDSTIDHKGTTYVATHTELGAWIAQLHQLAVTLTNEPEQWTRNAGS